MMNMRNWYSYSAWEPDVQQLRRWANMQRLEGNYVAAQATERLIRKVQRVQAPPRPHAA